MNEIKTDICVIGGGSGGLSLASGAVQMGAKVVLIEGGKMGGDCLNTGCVPSKAMIAAAKQAYMMGQGGPLGIAAVAPKIDFAAVKDHVRKTIATIEPNDSVERFEALGCIVLQDYARFISPTQVQAGATVVTARRFVIATGSSPFVPPIPGLDEVEVLTNENIFDLRAAPEHLIIIGGGPIGLEMAQAHHRLGVRVTVVEAATAFGRDDPELAQIVLDKMRGEGIEILEETAAERVSKTDTGLIVHTAKGDIAGSHLLMAVGRKVQLDGLDLEKGGVEYDRRGIKVSAGLRSVTNKRVYAAGDAAGGLQFTHVAGYHAGVIIRPMLFGLPAKARDTHIPHVTYTDPELAHVGLTEAEARKEFGGNVQVLRWQFDENDRAIAMGSTTGMIKVMVVRGRPVGASITGPQAGELIGLWAMAIANRLKMTAIANTVLPYPTLSEVSKRAAGAYFTPKLFESGTVKRVVGLVQRYLP
ncbi:MAG: FAD-dependent oxidoreductase [Rhodobacteraceae bacterium]|nr:FAD-dependent oxidoreductase [Paracoccaceae bacterium]PHR61761.1 MAG: dihydrolipoamide dehydrogenase [Robiginitomaculum sp.]